MGDSNPNRHLSLNSIRMRHKDYLPEALLLRKLVPCSALICLLIETVTLIDRLLLHTHKMTFTGGPCYLPHCATCNILSYEKITYRQCEWY
jgi:hypothetical protein